MEATLYNQEGAPKGKITLPEAVFNAKWNADLVHQVVTVMQGNARGGNAHSKNRGEVRGGGKKPWQQKGTGRARHGSIRSPLWKGGGSTFGPRNDKNYSRSLSRSMRQKALGSVLSEKYRQGEIGFVDSISFKEPKTRAAKVVFTALARIKGFEKLSSKPRNALMLLLPARDTAVEKSFGNFGNILVEEARNVSPLHLLTYRHVVFVDPKESLPALEKRIV